eukprot:GHUV01046809.1.p1 GENE.GHUV01046809.1~~GHUV01046809.1.p1  ORF type:complete len:185 (-),score=39.17 GHUV01046809.1:388-942(-)
MHSSSAAHAYQRWSRGCYQPSALLCTAAWPAVHCIARLCQACVHHAQTLHPAAAASRYGAQPDRGPAHVDVFRDFGPETAAAGGSKSPTQTRAGPSGPAAAAAAGAAANAPKLSDLFKPPAELVFMGDWQSAGAEAGKQGKWLLVNIQSPDEFATHRLNRDTWGDALVQDMLKGSFIFWQVCLW